MEDGEWLDISGGGASCFIQAIVVPYKTCVWVKNSETKNRRTAVSQRSPAPLSNARFWQPCITKVDPGQHVLHGASHWNLRRILKDQIFKLLGVGFDIGTYH